MIGSLNACEWIPEDEKFMTEPKVVINKPKVVKVKKHERTECNYLLMFFVLGVVTLAITDATTRR